MEHGGRSTERCPVSFFYRQLGNDSRNLGAVKSNMYIFGYNAKTDFLHPSGY